MLGIGIVYLVFANKLEERDRGVSPPVSFPNSTFTGERKEETHKLTQYQPPATGV